MYTYKSTNEFDSLVVLFEDVLIAFDAKRLLKDFIVKSRIVFPVMISGVTKTFRGFEIQRDGLVQIILKEHCS